jgi:tripartite-type tricarboxylate transporter receptor subunit TctC
MKSLVIALAFALPLAVIGEARSQAPGKPAPYPNKPVRLFVGTQPGSASDTAARIVAPGLSEIWKQKVAVENRPAAAGVSAAELVAKSMPDGYTLLMCSIASHAIGPAVSAKLPYDHIKDFAPIARVGLVPNVLVVHPSVPSRSVKDFVGYAKSNIGKVRYGSSGVGNSPHLTMELFRSVAGINVVHVPFPGGGQQLIDALVGGKVMVAFNNLPSQLPLVKSGKLRALGVTSATRNAQLKDVPTLIESGFTDFEVTVWSGLCAQAAVPPAIITKINGDAIRVMKMADARQRFAAQGIDAVTSTPEQFAVFIRSETSRWAQVARNAGLRK